MKERINSEMIHEGNKAFESYTFLVKAIVYIHVEYGYTISENQGTSIFCKSHLWSVSGFCLLCSIELWVCLFMSISPDSHSYYIIILKVRLTPSSKKVLAILAS